MDEIVDEYIGGVLLSLLMSGGEKLLDGPEALRSNQQILDFLVETWGLSGEEANKYAPKLRKAIQAAEEANRTAAAIRNAEEADRKARGETAEVSTGTALDTAVAKLSAGETLTQNDSRRSLQDEIAMQTLRDAGLITETVLNNAEGRQLVRQAVEQYTDQQAKSTSVNDDPADHTRNEQQIIEEYKNGVNEEIRSAFEKYLQNPDAPFGRYKISDVTARQAEDVTRLLGGDFSGYTNNINKNGINHIIIEHGPNGAVDNSMADLNDAARIGYVLDNYESVEMATYKKTGAADLSAEFRDKNNRPAPMLKFSKKVNGTYYVVEAVPDSQYNKFWVVSAYIGNNNAGSITQAPDAFGPRNTPKASLPSLPSAEANVPQPAQAVNTPGLRLGGGLSGLFLSGGRSGYNAVQFDRMGKEAFDSGSYRDYISYGLLADHDTEAYRYAEEIREKLNAGRKVTNIEMGRLTAAVYADALGVGEMQPERKTKEPDDSIWDGVFDEEDTAFQRDLAEAFDLDTPAREEALTEGLPEDIVKENFGIPPVTSEISHALIAEVQARGDKISPNEVLGITRDTSGRIVWLEKGHLDGKPSGLTHIMHEHEANFNDVGVDSPEITECILTAVAKGRIIGYQGHGTGRPIYEVVYRGHKLKIAVTVGPNGYIVGANPRGRGE